MMFETVQQLISDVSHEQEEAIFKAFLNSTQSAILQWPSSHKKACVLMRWVAQFFEYEKVYTESEVNAICKSLYHDYVRLRRMCVDVGILHRDIAGSKYMKH